MGTDKYTNDILNMAIRRYQGSTRFDSGAEAGNMSIKLMDNKKYMSDRDYEYRLEINKACVALEKQELIRIKWYDKDNIIERFQFNMTNIDTFYKITGTPRKVDILRQFMDEVKSTAQKVDTDWISSYLCSVIAEVTNKKKIPSYLEDAEKRGIVLNSLLGIDELQKTDQQLLERAFSKKYLKNSKTFEKKGRDIILGILKKYDTSIDKELSSEELLAEVGIEKTTAELFIKAPMVLRYEERLIDISNFPYGTALNIPTVKGVTIESIGIKRLISIENKANFIKSCESAGEYDAIVFSSGFYNPSQRKFLSMLREAALKNNAGCEFFHSGDLDFGGINIFRHTKGTIFPELKELDMNIDVMKANLEYAEEIKSKEYRQKLENLLNDDNVSEFHDLIRFILKKGRVLEQEALLI